MNTRSFGACLPLVILGVIATPVAAEEAGPKIIPKSAEGVDLGIGTGWHPLLRFSGNLALGQSKNSPGTADGVSLQLGYLINAGLDFLSEGRRSEWTNALVMNLSYTRTPVVDTFVKAADTIDFKSTYLYHPPRLPWVGPFVAFRLSAPMLKAYVVRSDPSNVVRLEANEEQAFDDAGNPVDTGTLYGSGKKIPLTDPFAPLTLRESVGGFAIPLDKPWLKTDFRLGFGAWETFVRDGFAVADNEDTADLFELRRMEDSVQLGPELGIALKGAYKDNLKYAASALFMQPIYPHTKTNPEGEKLTGLDLLNMEFEAGLGVKITQYFSIDYVFKAYRQPFIINDWQIQNNLLLTVVFEVPSPSPPPPACPPAPECPAPTSDSAAASTAKVSENNTPTSVEPTEKTPDTSDAGTPSAPASDPPDKAAAAPSNAAESPSEPDAVAPDEETDSASSPQ